MHASSRRSTIFVLLIMISGALLPAFVQAQREDRRVYLPLLGASGRSVSATALQDALDIAQPGDVITLAATTYDEDLTLERSGTASAPITVRGAGRGQTIIKGTLRLKGAIYVVIQDLDIDANSDDDAVWIEAPSQHITLQRMHLYDGEMYGVRIENDVQHVLIEDCEINDFDAGSSDAHGVGIKTASDITIRRCDIHHNSGDAIQSNTPDYPGYGRVARNIVIEDNDLHDNRENAVDIKSTHGALVRNNRMWGVRVADSSDGMAVQVQYDAQDITIIGNQIWDAVQGIEITRGNKSGNAYPLAPSRITIAGNLLRGIVKQGSDSGSGSALIVRSSADVQLYNNTTQDVAGAAIYISYSDEDDLPTDIDVRNNLLDGATNDLYFARDPALFTGLQVDYNHYVNGTVRGKPLADWLALGYERHATTGDPQLTNTFVPQPTSPLIDSGTDVGLPYSGAAPDRGWGELTPTARAQ